MPPIVLATAEEIRAIFHRAVAALAAAKADEEAADDDDDADAAEADADARYDEAGRRASLAREALRFCAAAAGALADPSLADVVVGLVDRLHGDDAYREHHAAVAGDALAALLAGGLQVDARVRRIAGHRDAVLRLAVARGLRPAGEPERALLRSLLQDALPEVRHAAAESLRPVADVPWWAGKWNSDPAARLLPSEVEATAPVLRRVTELLDTPRYALFDDARGLVGELVDGLARLPDEVAVEAAEVLCRAAERYDFEKHVPLLRQMLARAGGAGAFDRLVEHWGKHRASFSFRSALPGLVGEAPPEVRQVVVRRCLERVLATPAEVRADSPAGAGYIAASIVAAAWPPDQDITEVLDVLLRLGEEQPAKAGHDFVRMKLADALSLEGVDPAPVLDRLVEARLAGYPGAWSGLQTAADGLLRRGPRELLRGAAERALHGEDAGAVRWAQEQLLGPLYDPATDGAPAERAAVLASEPRLRSAALASRWLQLRMLPTLRAELRAGRLPYGEAVDVLEAVAALYGGLASPVALRRIYAVDDSPIPFEEERRKARAEIEPFLGPPELAGPPTEEEWAALRRARDASTGEGLTRMARRWMRSLSEGPWTPEERALLDEYVRHFRAGEVDALEYSLVSAIASKPELELLPLLDEVVRACRSNSRDLLKHMRSRVRTLLGVPRPPRPTSPDPTGEKTGAPPEDEWDDEDDD